MKGQAMELLNLLLLVVGVSILITISYFMMVNLKGMRKEFVMFGKYRRVTTFSSELFYTKLPIIQKTLAQVIGDRISVDNEIVYYGEFPKAVNTTEIILQIMYSYFEDNWYLKVLDEYGNEIEEFGSTETPKEATTLVVPLPIPSYVGGVRYIELKVW